MPVVSPTAYVEVTVAPDPAADRRHRARRTAEVLWWVHQWLDGRPGEGGPTLEDVLDRTGLPPAAAAALAHLTPDDPEPDVVRAVTRVVDEF